MDIKSLKDNSQVSSSADVAKRQQINRYGDNSASSQQSVANNASDTISFSNASRDLLKASSLLEKDEAHRANKVKDIKAKVEAGTYKIDSGEVAKSIISFLADGSAV